MCWLPCYGICSGCAEFHHALPVEEDEAFDVEEPSTVNREPSTGATRP